MEALFKKHILIALYSLVFFWRPIFSGTISILVVTEFNLATGRLLFTGCEQTANRLLSMS